MLIEIKNIHHPIPFIDSFIHKKSPHTPPYPNIINRVKGLGWTLYPKSFAGDTPKD
jgi:hypothetical protein